MMQINGLEANLLLFALNEYFGVDKNGRLFHTRTIEGYSYNDVQSLRDRLFDHHEHPPEMYERD